MSPMNANMNGSWCQQQQLHHSLKINKDSHMIKKPSSTTSSSSSSTSSLSNGNRASPPPSKPQQRHPVIIYTHSPKVIHTQPKDFMALVQKLTGMSRTNREQNKKKINTNAKTNNNLKVIGSNHEENESLSGISTNEDMAFHQQRNSFMGIPLYPAGFNNNNNDLLCCNSVTTTTDPTYDLIDYNVPFN